MNAKQSMKISPATKLSANELKLATNVILWFSKGSGETYYKDLGPTFGIDHDALLEWVKAEGYLWGDDEIVSLSVLPFLWRDFQHTSRTCKAFFQALLVLQETDIKVRKWGWACKNDPTLRLLETQQLRSEDMTSHQ